MEIAWGLQEGEERRAGSNNPKEHSEEVGREKRSYMDGKKQEENQMAKESLK